jgi:hypothetical protein
MIKLMSFKTYDNTHYLSAENGGPGPVDGIRTQALSWETFAVMTIDPAAANIIHGSQVAIRACHDYYVCAAGAGGGDLNANRLVRAEWETFTIEKVGGAAGDVISSGTQVHLRSQNGHYVCAEQGGGAAVNATRDVASTWETFTVSVTDVPDNVTVTLELMSVWCGDTEEPWLFGGDEFYLAGVAVSESGETKGILISPLTVNRGQTCNWNNTQLAQLSLPRESSFALVLQAYDQDLSHDWNNRPQWINDIVQRAAAAGATAVVAALATNPVGWGTIAAVVTGGLVAGGFVFAMVNDRDDFLGEYHVMIPAAGPANDQPTWEFSQGRTLESWHYKVNLRITRSV